jgi:hypothetical protein
MKNDGLRKKPASGQAFPRQAGMANRPPTGPQFGRQEVVSQCHNYFGKVFGLRHKAAFCGPTSTMKQTSLQSLSPPLSMSSKAMMMY